MMLRKSALVLAAVCGSAAFAAAAAVLPDLTAQAETSARASVQLTEENASLFLPGSREQYLELDAPSDAAFSDGYIAIEVNPHNLSFVDSLITGHAVTELHCIQIPTCLEEGIQWPAFIKAKPQLQIAEQKVLTDQRFLYIIYRFTPVPGTCQ